MKNNESKISRILDFLYKYRFIIMLCIFCLCLIFKVSGSSIGCWENIFNTKNSDFLIGVNRGVRSDEWATFTPLNFSQIENGFNYFNTSLRGTRTDVFMIYALPVIYIFQIFRPFLLGFIIFGAERGLSFFWFGRLIALFLVSVDFFMILTKKNKPLSLIASIMICLAPIMQWWFAINGIAEIFIFGELIIIMMYKYLNTDSFIKRLLYLLVIYISAGGYALVLYPAWQIPMAYVFFALAIWVIIDNFKKEKIKIKDIISIIIMVLLLGLSLFLVLNKSLDTIKVIMNTDYPGARFETGGGQLDYLFSYASNIFLSFKSSNLAGNQSEQALMFTLFPVGLILAFRGLVKSEKKDKLLIILLITYLILGIWCVVGFPRFLAKITLLYNTPAHRSLLALGFVEVLILIRSLSIYKESMSKLYALILSILLTGIVVIKNIIFHGPYLYLKMDIIIILECLYLFYTALRYNSKICKYLFCIGMFVVMFLCGGMVNPLRFGATLFTESEILENVKKIDKEDSGIWITEGENYPVMNYIAMAGVKTINVTNTYPDLEKWYKLDKEKKYKPIYNRYSHIVMNLSDEEKEDKFELLNFDVVGVNINLDDLDTLNIKYIFTRSDLEKYNNDKYEFKNMYNYNDFKVYKIIR